MATVWDNQTSYAAKRGLGTEDRALMRQLIRECWGRNWFAISNILAREFFGCPALELAEPERTAARAVLAETEVANDVK